MRPILIPCALLVAAVGALLAALRAQEPTRLEHNVTFEGELAMEAGPGRDFRLEVPAGAVVVDVRLSCPLADLDLYAHPGRLPADWDDPRWSSVEPFGDERITLDSFGEEPVPAGKPLFVRVEHPYDEAPTMGSRRLERVPFRLVARVFTPRIDARLQPGEVLAGVLTEESGGFRTFSIDVPPDAPALRIDLVDAAYDVDLFARPARNVVALARDTAFAQNPWGRETLLVLPGSDPPLRAGTWFLDVRDLYDPTRYAPFSVLVTFQAEPPPRLLELPALAASLGAGPLGRALAAVVEVATEIDLGSGTLVSPRGWILTNAHVVATAGEEVVVALPLDVTLPPRELFRGRVRRIDEALDLALIEVTAGFYGQPLPEGYLFPTVELRPGAPPAIGEPLALVGYPATGGSATRVSISATRGIVAGFEACATGRLLKTDAEITSGNSGGAALDEQGRLVGIPTSTIENGSGQLGYVQPLEALPVEWRALIEGAR